MIRLKFELHISGYQFLFGLLFFFFLIIFIFTDFPWANDKIYLTSLQSCENQTRHCTGGIYAVSTCDMTMNRQSAKTDFDTGMVLIMGIIWSSIMVCHFILQQRRLWPNTYMQDKNSISHEVTMKMKFYNSYGKQFWSLSLKILKKSQKNWSRLL